MEADSLINPQAIEPHPARKRRSGRGAFLFAKETTVDGKIAKGILSINIARTRIEQLDALGDLVGLSRSAVAERLLESGLRHELRNLYPTEAERGELVAAG